MFRQMTFEDMPNVTFSPESADGASRSVSPDGRTNGPFGRDRVPASRSAPPESSAEPATNATCGPCSPSLSASAALTACLANRLKTRFAMAGSIEYTQTWKQKTTPSGRRYWAHTASERRTGDCGFIGEAFAWMTPKASDGDFALPRTSGRPVEKSTHLQTQAAALAAWPTATSRDWKDGMEVNVPINSLLGREVWKVFLLVRVPARVLPGRESAADSG